jgi:hypothetical protein
MTEIMPTPIPATNLVAVSVVHAYIRLISHTVPRHTMGGPLTRLEG